MDFRDTVESVWEHEGHICAVALHPYLAHRCGYVCVDDDSPLNGVGYDDDAVSDICVHGGLTFARELCGKWAFGFDCGHAGDAPDVEAAIEKYGDAEVYRSNLLNLLNSYATFHDPITGLPPRVWSFDDVVIETMELCEQVCELEASLRGRR